MRQMGVARCRLDIAVPEQLADHRERLAERQGTGREGMAKIVQAHVSEVGQAPVGCRPGKGSSAAITRSLTLAIGL